ncbi:glycosyltransferase family 2 protein [Prosthecobacter sp.]|jgi:GT2 family glycosyltransferase|uniref:glycosyltransferase family 2 protein n=1 Tax=Prosthecobacter sp. TaxID=1965333 RepID=UPI0037C6822A
MTTFASIIIPTCDRINDLQRCLERILPQLPFDGSVEVLVTDDGSSTNVQTMVHSVMPAARWVRGPRRGPAANRNSAARMATAEWLIFIDDDCLPDMTCVHAYLKAMREDSSQVFVLEGAIRRSPSPPSLLWEAPENLKEHGHLTCSCNFAIRAETFHMIEGFDERYVAGVYAEDTDLSARLSSAGYSVKFLPEASVEHPIRLMPNAHRLAKRWEGKVIFAFDQGAPWLTISWRLPWHVLRVIQSRFRNQPWSRENRRALALFLGELLLVIYHTPAWVYKWVRRPRSRYWITNKLPVAKFGF